MSLKKKYKIQKNPKKSKRLLGKSWAYTKKLMCVG